MSNLFIERPILHRSIVISAVIDSKIKPLKGIAFGNGTTQSLNSSVLSVASMVVSVLSERVA